MLERPPGGCNGWEDRIIVKGGEKIKAWHFYCTAYFEGHNTARTPDSIPSSTSLHPHSTVNYFQSLLWLILGAVCLSKQLFHFHLTLILCLLVSSTEMPAVSGLIQNEEWHIITKSMYWKDWKCEKIIERSKESVGKGNSAWGESMMRWKLLGLI